uniref:Uncharacterized protein n=1 Tax=Arundo donax TaxID=35708 RepID=A0A0A9C7V6_ARUDO
MMILGISKTIHILDFCKN